MTTMGDTTAADAATRAMTEAEEVARMARTPTSVIVWYTTRRFAIMGAGLAAIGWIAQWALGASITIPELLVAPNWMSSFGGALFTLLVAVIAGAVYGVGAMVFARRMAAGVMPMHRHEGPWTQLRPIWWARFILNAAVLFLLVASVGSIWFLGQWVHQGMPRPTKTDWDGVLQFIAIAISAGVLGGAGLLLSDAVGWLYDLLRPKLLASRVWWSMTCAVVGVLMTIGLFAPLAGAAFLVHPLFVSLGIGPTRTLGTAISLLLLAGWSGIDSARHMWGDRQRVQKDGKAAAGLSRNDYWNWDIEAETSYGGTAPNGYPFLVWRESADNRLGLSRPRYCCITEQEDGLFFTFFNPSGNIRATGGLAVFCGVAVLVAIAMFATYLLESRPALPYHLDMTPPPFVVLVGTVLAAAMLGAVTSGAWYVLITLLRWHRGRFEGDGHRYMMPLRSLLSFNEVHAGEAGAQVSGERAKTGHALTAAFENGSMWILTGNAWNYPSIVAKHANLTNAFREPRDKYLAEWETRRKEAARKGETAPLAQHPRSAQGIPDRL